MFRPCEVILYYSLLIPQEYVINTTPNFNHSLPDINSSSHSFHRPWYENKKLITNDNIFDINDLQKLDIEEPVDDIK